MKQRTLFRLFIATTLLCATQLQRAAAQGMHFSQFYNAPLLLNPANTALMSENDYRVGMNYRSQWAQIPAPYKTMSAFADFQAFKNESGSNWLGIGGAVFSDKAGDGQLALTRFDLSVAYHIMMGEVSMISAGLSGGFAQRSINFDKLSFNEQWDGFQFNYATANGEANGIVRSSFYDVGAGVNYAYFPTELLYIKIGAGVAHINQPNETFYDGTPGVIENKMGIRPTGNVDVLMKLNETFTLNPSVYYTTQKGAYELLFGGMGMVELGEGRRSRSRLIVGAFYRWDEAIVGAFGVEFSGFRAMVSYDYTTSKLATENKGNGALELGLNFQGMYGSVGGRRTINCPRF